MDQIFNPYLPSYEYVPDAEPHVFNGRVYIYGSHDIFNGGGFCLGDYVTYSADIHDLKHWKYEGIIFRKDQDEDNKKKKKALYAPDCVQGEDGNYYLYYSVNGSSTIGVAKSASPSGPFEFYGYVHYKDGTVLGKKKSDVFQFDPGIYREGKDIYLYSGFCPDWFTGIFVAGGRKVSSVGPLCMKLDSDMLTILDIPHGIGVRSIASSRGTPFEGHEFFEASSMRKIRNKYYFIYSSYLGHELCYATSDFPDRDFVYGGTIVSIGDVGLNGRKGVKDAANFTGNTHGSILEIDGKFYIFYHRQTNRDCFSRQACAEEITVSEDGSIPQVEVTSQGFNGGPLEGKGTYSSRIACNLECRNGGVFYRVFKGHGRPYFTQKSPDNNEHDDQYIADVSEGTKITFKYFDFRDASSIDVSYDCSGEGTFCVYDEKENKVAELKITGGENKVSSGELKISSGVHSLRFVYSGRGKVNFYSFTLK